MKTKLFFLLVMISFIMPHIIFAQVVEVDGVRYQKHVWGPGYAHAMVLNKSSGKYSGAVVIREKVSISGVEWSVAYIYDEAFYGCSGLTSITIPNSMKGIGEKAFYGCSGLTSITIPNSVTSIDSGAFKLCSGLTSVNITDLTSWCNIYFGNIYANPAVLAHKLVLNGKEIKDLVIPEGVTAVKGGAFAGCSGLTSVTIPNSVTSIEWRAFDGCSGLTSITIPNSVKSIGHYAFCDCSGLTSITIPNSVKSIGNHAFCDCSGLTSITIPNSVTSIEYGTFQGCSGLTSITIPNSVTSIGSSAFSGCTGLTSVTIPNSVTSIEDNEFSGCSGLTSVTIPNSVRWIGYRAFSGCSSLTSITIPNSVTSIRSGAFEGCYIQSDKFINNSSCYSDNNWGATLYDEETADGLLIKDNVAVKCRPWSTSVTIPNSVTSIGSSAFSGCSGLTSITIPNSVTNVGDNAFSGCSGLTSITIPNSVTSVGDNAFEGCSSLPVIDNIRYADCVAVEAIDKELSTYIIKEGARFICNSAFYGCSSLTSITIPNSVTDIGEKAFYGCSGLTSITIPNSVTDIGEKAFYDCSGLATVNVSCKDMEDFDNYVQRTDISSVFHGSELYGKSHNIYIAGELQTDITIPNSVTSIGDYAFYKCRGLTSITIPNSVTSIGYQAFLGCSGLTSVTIPNSVTSIGNNAFSGCSGLTKIYSLAEVPPTAYSSTFSKDIYTKATLYVPSTGNALAKYSEANMWGKFVNIKEFDPNKCISVTTSDKGYATFYSSESAYTLPNGLSACVVTACSGNKLTYRTIADGSEGGVIPQGTAVVLVNGRKTASNFTLMPSESNASYTGTNYLHGSDEATTTTAGGSNYYYKLTYGEGADSDTFGWYWGAADGSAFQIDGHKAWLAVPKASAARSVFFMDDLTSIEDVPVREDNDILYNLQGRRVSSMNKAGIYIVNGKKVIKSK